jgi:transposase
MLTVKDFQKVRVAIENEKLSQREVARQYGHGRNTIRKVLADSDTQPQYKRKNPAPTSLDPYRHIIDAWLEDEARRGVPRKQRSNAVIIQRRLREEHGYPGSVYPIRRYLKKRSQSFKPQDVFFTLEYKPGEEAQVDWGQAEVTLGDTACGIHLFCLRLSYSRAAYVRAYPCEKLECFMDGHVQAFRYLGGVPKRCAYDNLRSAVIQVGKCRERKLNGQFRRFLAHYALQTRFCNVASGNEKGRVENLVKLAQRDFLAGAPSFRDIDELNAHLERCCREDLRRMAPRTGRTRESLLAEELSELMPIIRGDGPAYASISTFAGKDSLAQFERNYYSVPVSEAFASVVIRGYVDRVEIWKGEIKIAQHRRLWDAGQFALDYLHFIPLLAAKPGGLGNARAFMGEPWGEDFSRFRVELNFRNPEGGERDFVELLLLFAEHPEAEVKRAVAECARLRAWSVAAVKSAISYSEPPAARQAMDISRWPGLSVETDGIRPASEYDAILLAPDALPAENKSEASVSAIPVADAELARYDELFGAVMFSETVKSHKTGGNRRGGHGT